MSGNMYGADIEALRLFSDQIAQGGETLSSVVGIVESAMPDPSQWSGADADSFREEWSGAHAPLIMTTAQALADVAATVRRNADAQEATSNELGGPGGSPFPGETGSADGTGDTGLDLWPSWLNDLSTAATWTGLGVATIDNLLAGSVDDLARMAPFSDDAARLLNLAEGAAPLAKGLSGLGAVLGGVQLIDGIADGNGWQIADGGINTALGIAGVIAGAATPAGWVVLGAGAVWAGAGLLATHLGYGSTSEMFVDAGAWVGNKVADGAGAVWDGVENAAGAVADAGEAIADGAEEAWDAVTGWF